MLFCTDPLDIQLTYVQPSDVKDASKRVLEDFVSQ